MKYLGMLLMLRDISKVYEEEVGKGKPWYASRRFIGVCLGFLGFVAAQLFGIAIDQGMIEQLADTWVRAVPDVVFLYGVVMTIVGVVRRNAAKKKAKEAEGAMKKLLVVLAVAAMLAGCGFHQTWAQTGEQGGGQEEPSQALLAFGPFGFGQDNGFYAGIGEKGFVASGIGVDFASAWNGNILLHASLLTRWTDDPLKKVLPALSVNVDVIKLATARGKVTILIPDLRLALGPSIIYNIELGRVNPGMMFNISYAF